MYAWSPSIGSDRQILLADGSFKEGSPMLEAVAFTMRTPLGSYLPDPDDGLDFSIVKKIQPDTPVRWSAEIKRALKRYVDGGMIRNLSVVVEVQDGGRILDEVSFVDPRDTAEPRRVRTQR